MASLLSQADLRTRRVFYKHHPCGLDTSSAPAACAEPNVGVDSLPDVFQDAPLGPLSRLHLC